MNDELLSLEELDVLLNGGSEGKRGVEGGQLQSDLERILQLPLRLSVCLGETRVPLGELMDLEPGTVLELGREITKPVDVQLNGRFIARGEVVIVEEHFAVRITEILDRENRLKELGD